jgi:hypothetical protein
MAIRQVFFSFHHQNDIFRVNQIRNSNIIQASNEDKTFHDKAEYEKIMRQDDANIKTWIEKQLKGASVTCVLIGSDTYSREWVKYEIRRSFELDMGIFAVHINDLKSIDGKTSPQGRNPLQHWSYKGTSFENLFTTYDPQSFIKSSQMMTTKEVSAYDIIVSNIGKWAEEAAKQVGR